MNKLLPKISVVIPAYNEEGYIGKTLKTIKNQTYQGPIEIIVVNNGSTDKTAQVVKKLGIKVINESKKGAANARQAGLISATGEIVATTDSDALLPKDWLSRIVQEFEKHPKAVAITGLWNYYDGSPLLRFLTWVINPPSHWLLKWYSGANSSYKRSAALKIGGYNTKLTIAEDCDIIRRLKSEGEVFRFISSQVKVSARRFQKLGLIGAVWDHIASHLESTLSFLPKPKTAFRSGSEV